MKDAPAFDFYPERWLAGVAMFSDAEQLAYLRLLCHQWIMDGLPESAAMLKRLAGRGCTEAILEKFPMSDDGKRRNTFLEKLRAEQRDRIAKARASAQARWGKRKCSTDANASTEHMRTHDSSIISPPTTHHSPYVLLEKEPKGAGAPGEAKRRKVEDQEDFESACRVTLDSANPALLQAWDEWQAYRQRRHRERGQDRLRWTLRAAQLSAKQILQAAELHTPQVVADRIASAVIGDWQGLNFDKLQAPALNGHNSRNSTPTGFEPRPLLF